MAIHSTMTYHGDNNDPNGMPDPWFHYLVVASPGPKPGSGTASIVSLSEARAKAIGQGPSHTIIAKEGGPEAALKMAEQFLDDEHAGLKKIVSHVLRNGRQRNKRIDYQPIFPHRQWHPCAAADGRRCANPQPRDTMFGFTPRIVWNDNADKLVEEMRRRDDDS